MKLRKIFLFAIFNSIKLYSGNGMSLSGAIVMNKREFLEMDF
jgi:hypothetical protein